MKLRAVTLKGFRCYKEETRIVIDDLTAFVGRNDVGKSSILEALEIFFNNTLVTVECPDACVFDESKVIEIGCAFDDLPGEVVLDEQSTTSLNGEYLLNEKGQLEIRKHIDCNGAKPKESVFAFAVHPDADGVGDLLLLKQTELKKRMKERNVSEEGVDLRSNPPIRKAIWASAGNLSLRPKLIALDKEDGKRVWTALEKQLPIYALFRADRPSKDDDAEVQDPMKFAVTEAIKSLNAQLDAIKAAVQAKTTEVARRTLEKLKEIEPTLANELEPNFRADPKWESLFKLTLTTDNQIPINKRGSGTRRLILLSFFRAEAERKQAAIGAPGIIYAIEEPELSQHPINQRMLVEAFGELAQQGHSQVLITTHVPGLAGLLPVNSLRYVRKGEDGDAEVLEGSPALFQQVAEELGVLPDSRVKVLACVEGPNDVEFLTHYSRICHSHDATIPDLSSNSAVALIPIGGSTLKQWVDNRYLKNLGLPEVHLYDRGTQVPPKYQEACARVNAVPRCYAALTGKREIENYLHPDAIQEAMNIRVVFGDNDSVPERAAEETHNNSGAAILWGLLDEEKRERKISRVKQRLNSEAVAKMTPARITASDLNRDLENWLRQIALHL